MKPTIIYFTHWGIYMSTATYTFFTLFTIRYHFFLTTKESIANNFKNIYSSWLLWKWSVFFYCASLTYEIIITLFFWVILYPSITNPSVFTFLDHIAPIVILLLDYVMNRIPFSIRHLPVAFALLIIYLLVNMIWTL
jgi:hypothetical protein